MRQFLRFLGAVALLLAGTSPQARCDPPAAAMFPSFQMQEFEIGLKIGYAVLLTDLNHDGKPDIVVVDKHRLLWYENPTWKMRVILNGKTPPDNVCVAALDIDKDGQLDLVLGAGWAPFNTKEGGTLHWLKRGKPLDEEWTLYPITEEPTVHRVRVADVFGTGEPAIILSPLMGRDSSRQANWMDGRPVRTLAFAIPKNPFEKSQWQPIVLDETLHVVHNLWPIPRANGKGEDLLLASYEGVSAIRRIDQQWKTERWGQGNQDNPQSNRGASEIKMGKLRNGQRYIATIEPWHGYQVVVYTEPKTPGNLWSRQVIDEQLQWGHAVWCADLDGDGDEELIIGIRDDRGKTPKPGERRGIRLYKPLQPDQGRWARHILENGGVAVEDLAATDLDGDGRIDIVAVGRQTGNGRIYWNKGKP